MRAAACPRRRSSVAHQKSLKFRVVRLFRKEPSFIKAESGGGSMHVRMKVDFGQTSDSPAPCLTTLRHTSKKALDQKAKLAEADPFRTQI